MLNSPAGRSLGYRQVLEFLHHTWDFPAEGSCSTYQPNVWRSHDILLL